MKIKFFENVKQQVDANFLAKKVCQDAVKYWGPRKSLKQNLVGRGKTFLINVQVWLC